MQTSLRVAVFWSIHVDSPPFDGVEELYLAPDLRQRAQAACLCRMMRNTEMRGKGSIYRNIYMMHIDEGFNKTEPLDNWWLTCLFWWGHEPPKLVAHKVPELRLQKGHGEPFSHLPSSSPEPANPKDLKCENTEIHILKENETILWDNQQDKFCKHFYFRGYSTLYL